MHLTRITSGTAGPTAASGSDADVLALLLGGESGAAGPSFPATLQAALGEGASLTEQALDATELVAGDDDASAGDPDGTSLDAALAAALALAAAVAAPVDPAAPADAGGDAGAEAGAGGAANQIGGTVAAEVLAVTTSTPAGVPAAVATDASTDVDAQAATSADAQAASDDATARTTSAALRAEPQIAGTSAAVTYAAAGEVAGGRPAAATAPGHAGTATPAHQATGALAGTGTDAAGSAAFSAGGNAEHGLDLSSSDRQQTFALAEKPASSVTTATAPGLPGEAPPATTAGAAAGSDAGAAALPPLEPTTSTPQQTATTRVERPGHHPGGIEARWGERVADALRLSSVRGGGEIRLQLEPEGLGHIDVRLHLQSDGVRAVIVAEHESTRALLTSQQHVLQDAFNRSDLRLTGFSVDVGSGGGAATFGQEGDRGQGTGAQPTPAAPAVIASAAQDIESTTALVNGRVNVRV
jgi:flagellar hook-length control protein FliK